MQFNKIIQALLLVFAIVAAPTTSAVTPDTRSLMRELATVINNRGQYYAAKDRQIDSLRRAYERPGQIPALRMGLAQQIYDEYISYQGDSALVYAKRLAELAEHGTSDDIAAARVALLQGYINNGLFTEARDIVNGTDLRGVSTDIKIKYFLQCLRLYADLGDFVSDKATNDYPNPVEAYADSVIFIAVPDSYEALYASVFRDLHSMTPDRKIALFKRLYDRRDTGDSNRATISAILADFYNEKGMIDSMIYFKAHSVIYDIQTAKHETTSACALAIVMHREGESELAQQLIQLASEDANYYNARLRKIGINSVIPIIEQGRVEALSAQRDLYVWLTVIAVVLLSAMAVMIFYIIRQMHRLRQSSAEIARQRDQIRQANDVITRQVDELTKAKDALEQSNSQILETNERLREAMKIKDEYVGYAFNLSANYQARIDSLYKTVESKLSTKQYDELRRMIIKRDAAPEKDAMLKEFDHIFLRLFPTFIKSYNAMFPPRDAAERHTDDGTLTSEQRIFALIRLGITDSQQIATMLNYSASTVNTYKSKAKNRSILPNDQFEAAIMAIHSVE